MSTRQIQDYLSSGENTGIQMDSTLPEDAVAKVGDVVQSGTLNKTLGTGKDFETFEEFQTYLDTTSFGTDSLIMLTLEDKQHDVTIPTGKDALVRVDSNSPRVAIVGTDKATTIVNVLNSDATIDIIFYAEQGGYLALQNLTCKADASIKLIHFYSKGGLIRAFHMDTSGGARVSQCSYNGTIQLYNMVDTHTVALAGTSRVRADTGGYTVVYPPFTINGNATNVCDGIYAETDGFIQLNNTVTLNDTGKALSVQYSGKIWGYGVVTMNTAAIGLDNRKNGEIYLRAAPVFNNVTLESGIPVNAVTKDGSYNRIAPFGNNLEATLAEIEAAGPTAIASKEYVDSVANTTGGLFQFSYKVKILSPNTTPPEKFLGFDDIDMAAATNKLYINKIDSSGNDMSLFLAGLKAGDYFNIHDDQDIAISASFDIVAGAVLNGDIFMLDVVPYSHTGTLTNNRKALIYWRSDGPNAVLTDGTKNMDTGYTPANDLSVATKKYVDDNSGTGGCDMTADQCAGVKANVDLTVSNKVVDEAQLTMHENNTLSHVSSNEHAALAGSATPSGSNVFATMADLIPGIKGDKGDAGADGADSVVPGPQGIKGDPGNHGLTGDTGLKGDAGDAATLNVGSTSTGAAGSDASVTNSGSTSAAVFDFVVPRGDTGAQGAKGDAGTAVSIVGNADHATIIATNGNAGDMWILTDSGAGYDTGDGMVSDGGTGEAAWTNVGPIRGPEGPTGSTGTQGIPGAKGDKGDDGDQGLVGATGNAGADSVVPGPQGTKGDTGAASTVPGPKGDAGADSTVAGPAGSDGANGLKGDKGDTGDQGIQGEQGDAGAKGDAGADSTVAGPQGLKGDAGTDGTDSTVAGPQGVPGAKGDDGAAGLKGDTGATGLKGDTGTDGISFTIKGSDSHSNIVSRSGTAGDMWIVNNINAVDLGHGLVSDGAGVGSAHWSDIGLIRGPEGPEGAAGTAGSNGSDGSDGLDSVVPGPQGIQGVKGDTGDDSTVAGPQGLKGDTGSAGADSTVAGPQGPKGDAGNDGADSVVAGPQGVKGDTGNTGADSTVAGPAGAKGDKGDPGTDGTAGAPGTNGSDGSDGAVGPAGPNEVSADADNGAVIGTDSKIFVPEGIPKTGGDVTGDLVLLDEKGIHGVDDNSTKIHMLSLDTTSEAFPEVLIGHINGNAKCMGDFRFNSAPKTLASQGTHTSHLTRKDYVDGKVLNKVDSDVAGITGASKINNMVTISQANFDAIATPDPLTFYVIVGQHNEY